MLNIEVISNQTTAGNLRFDSVALERFTHLTPASIFITRNKKEERKRVEKFIHDVFFEIYGATIDSFYPTLMSVHDEWNNIFAAVGFRSAGECSLFLEQYLEQPIDDIAHNIFGNKVKRSSIVEVGNLAATAQGASIFLFVAMTAYFKQMGFSHLVFTGTKALHLHFRRMGLNPQLIGSAKPDALEDASKWGSYYETEPRIIIADINQSHEHLRKILAVDYTEDAKSLHSRLHLPINDWSI